MTRVLPYILALVAANAVAGCSHRPPGPRSDQKSDSVAERAARLATKIQNNDVKWNGTGVGLMSELTGPGSAELASLGDAAVPPLLRALYDPNRFAVAHVLLTRIAGEPYRADAERWNGLRVDLYPDGRVELHPDDIPGLVVKWDKWKRQRATRRARDNR